MFGNCWLACELWHQLGLDEFWQQRLPEGRETVNWEKVLRLLRIGAAKKEAGRAFGFVKIRIPEAGQTVTRETFLFQVDKAKLKTAEQRDGHYLLRSNLTGEDPAVLWTRYVQLTQIESVFRCLKSELGIRPIYHQLEHRADAHVLIAFLAYCLQVTLKNRLLIHAPGLTPAAVFEKVRPWPPSGGWQQSSTSASALDRPTGRSCAAASTASRLHETEPYGNTIAYWGREVLSNGRT
jgi:hypothetical protein